LTLIHRRSFLLGLGAAFAAPAIVKAESLMKVPARRLLTTDEIVNSAVEMLYGRSPLLDALPLMMEQQRIWFGVVGGQVVHTVVSDAEFYCGPVAPVSAPNALPGPI
jgi:hypothetical protein